MKHTRQNNLSLSDLLSNDRPQLLLGQLAYIDHLFYSLAADRVEIKMAESTAVQEPQTEQDGEPSPFQKFKSLAREVVNAPKAEVDRRMDQAKQQRAKRPRR